MFYNVYHHVFGVLIHWETLLSYISLPYLSLDKSRVVLTILGTSIGSNSLKQLTHSRIWFFHYGNQTQYTLNTVYELRVVSHVVHFFRQISLSIQYNTKYLRWGLLHEKFQLIFVKLAYANNFHISQQQVTYQVIMTQYLKYSDF